MNTAEETRPCVNCGEYRLEREIGRGAYGVVYLAEGPNGDLVAVKVCRREDIGEERYERELRGAKLYSAIPPQEGLVPMFEIVEEPWGFYAVMGLADDEFGRESMEVDSYRPKTLASVISGEKALSLKECVEIGITLAKGLAALQRHHLLHRDIKPGNVLFFEGRPVLSDPGLVVEESNAVSSVGTPGYLPPERKFTGPTSDIYCLGLTLKAASFGRHLEDLDKGPSAEADIGAAHFPAWWRILNKATDLDSSRRYQSAKALLRELKSLRAKAAIPSVNDLALYVLAIAVLIIVAVFAWVANAVHGNVNTARRDAQWMMLEADNLNNADMKASFVDWKIDEVAATNEVVGAELRSLVDRMKNLGGKVKSLSSEIKLLSDRVPKSMRDGSSDKKDFQSASKLAEERKNVRKEIDAIYKELNKRLGFKGGGD